MKLNFLFKKKFFLGIIKKPFFIGVSIAILLSIAPISYMALELNNKNLVNIVAEFVNNNSEFEWKTFKSFSWTLLPIPSLKWEGIELKEKHQAGSINIKEISMSLSSSKLLNGIIYVKKLDINNADIKVNGDTHNVADIFKKIFGFAKEIQSNKEAIVKYKDTDIDLSEFFIFNPYIISIKDASFSHINKSTDNNYSCYKTNITLTKRINNKSLLQLSYIELKSTLVVNGFEVLLQGKCTSSIDNDHNGVISLDNANYTFISLSEPKINIKLSGNLEYDYNNDFIQSNIKTSTQNIQKLASVLKINIPKRINNTDFSRLSLTTTIIYKDGFLKCNNILMEAPDFNLQGKFNYSPNGKKIFSTLKGSGLVFDKIYKEYTSDIPDKNITANNKDNTIITILNKFDLLKYISNKNLHILYSPKYFQWNNIVLNYPSLEIKKTGDQYSLHYESDINSGKFVLSSNFIYLNSSIESKTNCSAVSLDIETLCLNSDVCKGLQGDVDIMSDITMNIDNERYKISGVAELNTENIFILGMDLDYAYHKVLNAIIDQETEYTEAIAKTQFTQVKSKLTIEDTNIKFFKIEAHTKKNKISGSGVLDTQSNKAEIKLKIDPTDFEYLYDNEYLGNFYDMVLPIVCKFNDGHWICEVDKNIFKKYLQKKKLNKELIEKILNMDLY